MKLIYFAWLRERLGINEETVDIPPNVDTVGDLMQWLAARNELFSDVFEHADIIQVAIDQKHERDRMAPVKNASEIAFFPPMTGG